MRMRSAIICVLTCLSLASCATKPHDKQASARTAFAPTRVEETQIKDNTAEEPVTVMSWFKPQSPVEPRPVVPGPVGDLAGRTLTVSSISDIQLNDKEVVLTFDDGPIPGRTNKVLDILAEYDVRATFLMVGQMAGYYPALAKRVVAEGHSIGSHTFNHANLRSMRYGSALNDIASGDVAVQKATGTPSGFFRFPYLADTTPLRQDVGRRGLVILDVDIDSKDYVASSPDAIIARTMAQVRRKGKGIILMHDIHTRTAAMLPGLLSALKSEGYKVVTLQYGRPRRPGNLLVASAPEEAKS